MAKKATTRRTRKTTTTAKKNPDVKDVVTSKEDDPKKVAITPATVASAEIIEKAVKATTKTTKKAPKKEGVYPGDKPEVQEAAPSQYEVLLGRYCRAISEYNNDVSDRRPIGDFINLMKYVYNSSQFQVYNDMLKFFILEHAGLMNNHNALNGIETITDLKLKTKVMTAFTVFSGLAVLKTTGKKVTFSIGAVRQIINNDKFSNWVNVVANS